MYTSIWVKFSSNWVGHLSSVNKIFYWQVSEDPVNSRARLYLLGRGGGSENLLVEAVTQGTPTGDQRLLRSNLVPSAQFVRGRWHRVETLVRCNTGSNSDGKNKSNKAENGKGIEGALGPGGLRGRVFGAAHGETEGFNSRSWGPPGQTSASRTSAVDLLDAVRQPARGSEGWAVVGGRMIREGS
jgi:hypothetical protein